MYESLVWPAQKYQPLAISISCCKGLQVMLFQTLNEHLRKHQQATLLHNATAQQAGASAAHPMLTASNLLGCSSEESISKAEDEAAMPDTTKLSTSVAELLQCSVTCLSPDARNCRHDAEIATPNAPQNA